MATSRPSRVSRARYTVAIPPAPSGVTTRYGPIRPPSPMAMCAPFGSIRPGAAGRLRLCRHPSVGGAIHRHTGSERQTIAVTQDDGRRDPRITDGRSVLATEIFEPGDGSIHGDSCVPP